MPLRCSPSSPSSPETKQVRAAHNVMCESGLPGPHPRLAAAMGGVAEDATLEPADDGLSLLM